IEVSMAAGRGSLESIAEQMFCARLVELSGAGPSEGEIVNENRSNADPCGSRLRVELQGLLVEKLRFPSIIPRIRVEPGSDRHGDEIASIAGSFPLSNNLMGHGFYQCML